MPASNTLPEKARSNISRGRRDFISKEYDVGKSKVANIGNDHHIVRHCKNKLLIRKDGEAVGVFPELFHLRPPTNEFPQETTLSAVYFEFFDGDHKMKSCHSSIAVALTPKPKDALVRLNVGLIKDQGEKRSRQLRVTHEPDEPASPAYSVVRGIPVIPDDELNGLLATLAIIEIVEVRTLLQLSADSAPPVTGGD
jgi:hypothetical protein